MGSLEHTDAARSLSSGDNAAGATAHSKSGLTAARPGSGLTASVGLGGANRPDDVEAVSSTLHANGLFEDGPVRQPSSALFSGIIKAQEGMDANLKRDGLINPGGPTETTFSRMRDQGFVRTAKSRVDGEIPEASPDAGSDVAKAVHRHNVEARAEARAEAAEARARQEAAARQQRDLAKQAEQAPGQIASGTTQAPRLDEMQ
jgi:hypothetical protein